MFQHPAQKGFLAAQFGLQGAELNKAAHFRQAVGGAPGGDRRQVDIGFAEMVAAGLGQGVLDDLEGILDRKSVV